MPPDLPVIIKTKEFYISVSKITEKLPAAKRQSLGARLETTTLTLLEYLVMARSAPKPEKSVFLLKCTALTDILSLYLQILINENLANQTTLHQLSAKLTEISRMTGGWRKANQ